MDDPILVRLRQICQELPEAVETGGVGSPSFKVRAKIFAMRHPMNERPSLWCKAPRGAQEVLISAHDGRFFVPPYVGQHGWIGIWLDGSPDWDEIADLVRESYIMTAPKRLSALLNSRP